MERFKTALSQFRTSHGHRSWWAQLEATLQGLADDIADAIAEERSETLEALADHEDRIHQMERGEEYDSYG